MTVPELEMKVLDLRDNHIQRAFMKSLTDSEALVWIEDRYMSWNALDKATKPEGWE
jgi:hypothetical protein